MIIGFVKVEDGAVLTHRDSFILDSVSVVSVRRPYLAGSILLGTALLGFAIAFADLLYTDEMITIAAVSLAILIIGLMTGHLTLLSRDLKGSELSSAIWGTPRALQQIRQRIVIERQKSQTR
ncbi:MAG: hypothetical protein AAF542_07450 [Pseudomonadota bacterium]